MNNDEARRAEQEARRSATAQVIVRNRSGMVGYLGAMAYMNARSTTGPLVEPAASSGTGSVASREGSGVDGAPLWWDVTWLLGALLGDGAANQVEASRQR